MKLMGKIFAILVLLLAIAVAVLSFMLAKQREIFRAHSEELAAGLLRVATEVKNMNGVDVSSEMSQVSYTKAPKGGKESGTLGFEDFRKNQGSVKSSVDKLIAGLKRRQDQMEAFAATLEKTGNIIGVEAVEGVNKQELLANAEYKKKLGTLEGRAQLVLARDEAVRKYLSQVADTFGLDNAEVDTKTFAACAKDTSQKYGFSIGKLFTELDIANELLQDQQEKIVKAMIDFEKKVDTYTDWNFNGGVVSDMSEDFRSTSKSDNDDGKSNRDKYLKKVENKLSSYDSDALALNKFISDKLRENKSLKEQTQEMRNTVESVQEDKEKLSKRLSEVSSQYKVLEGKYKTAEEHVMALNLASQLRKEEEKLEEERNNRKKVEELKDVDESLSCDIRHVEPNYNFVIISANNRQLCPGTKLIVLSGNGNETKLKANLDVKECNDYLSKAFVTRGDINQLSIGDRVVLSVDHEALVKKEAQKKADEAEAKLRAEREAEHERARKAIEARKEAERQSNGEEF
ncbi:MAG: hypothetical protein J6X55_12380 [Victivallales bacterium]|nr:hypothetical protein [Victivallales bacterium]